MIEWHDPNAKLPEDGDECLLLPQDDGSIITNRVFGPIAWHANSGAWLDLFATPEAGEIVSPKLVGLWTLWEPIMPSPTPRPTPPSKPPEA